MSDLGEIELRILALLEELGSEDIATLMTMVHEPKGSEEEVAQFQEAARRLIEQGYVDLLMESQPTGEVQLSTEDALAEVEALPSHLYFNVEGNHWSDDRIQGPPYFQIQLPELARTDLGLAAGARVLDERGYEWWRKDDK